MIGRMVQGSLLSKLRFMSLELLLIYLSLSLESCHGARILLSSGEGCGSHFMVLSTIGRGLADNDHHVTALISESYNDKASDHKFSHLSFDVFPDSTTSVTKNWSRWVMKYLLESRQSLVGGFRSPSPKVIHGLLKQCSELLDHALERKRQGIQYDLLIIDAHKGCSVLLAAALNIPYVLVVPSGIKPSLARRYGSPDTTAYYPEMSSGLASPMNFPQRFLNTLFSISEDLSVFFTYNVYSYLFSFKYSFTKPVSRVLSSAPLILVNSDFAVDFPFPLLPNVITVGGLTTRKAHPLNQEWMDLMSMHNRHGVVLFTLGTYIDNIMTPSDMNRLAEAFRALPQTVIWQTTQEVPPNVSGGSNIRIVSWMPQNDLLGHPAVRVLVFHGGNNGMYEAVYHGVPMVVIPMVLDTLDVAARIVERGMGLSLDYFSMTSDDLTRAIVTVITNSSYKANTMRASAIIKERPLMPLNRTVFWVEHVLKYGGSYLRPSSPDLYFWQRQLLDVYVVMILMVYICYRLLCLIGRVTKRYLIHHFSEKFRHSSIPRFRRNRLLRSVLGISVLVSSLTFLHIILYQ